MARNLCALLICLFFAAKAHAYPTPVDFDGQLLRWHITRDSPPVSYEVIADRVADQTIFAPAVADAAQMWTDIPGSYFAYAPVEEGATAQVSVHLQSAIDGGTYSAGYAIFDEYDDSKPARPKHCAIYVAITDDQSYMSISKTILHELGHCVGLGHTLIPEAIMSYSLDKNSYALDIDDQAAATRLYPSDGSKPQLPPGCAVGSATSGGGSIVLLVVPIFLALFSGARARRAAPVRGRATPGAAPTVSRRHARTV